MTPENAGTEWTFVIDTDDYAGKFEREMCAYITGCTGDCGVGSEFAELADKEVAKDILEKFDDYIANVPDEHGCNRPVTIWPSTNWWNDGIGNQWRNDDSDIEKHRAAYAKSYADIYNGYMKTPLAAIESLKNGIPYSNWTIAAAAKEITANQKIIDKAKNIKKLKHHPAYNSVGIWFQKKPTAKLIKLMKERAQNFAKAKRDLGQEWDKDFELTIEGFRLVYNIHKSEEVTV
jgi:hypothetical protein